MRALRSLLADLTDPFGFSDAFRDLHIAPQDLPSLTREGRLCGDGV